MLDSFDANEPHDALTYLQTLCESTLVSIYEFAKVEFKEGWRNIVEKFVDNIKNQPIILLVVSDEFGDLSIDFKCREKAMEVRVWRAAHYARKQSLYTCMGCGYHGARLIRSEKMVVFCRICMSKLEVSGSTGTWLDKY